MKTTSIILLLFWVICFDGYSQNSWHGANLGISVTTVGVPASGKDSNSLVYLSNAMFAGTENGQLLVRSETTSTWTTLASGFQKILSIASDTLHGVNYLGTENGLFRSMDGGRTWSNNAFSTYEVWDLEVVPSTGMVYVVAYKVDPFVNLTIGIHKSNNQGASWQTVYAGIICRDVYFRNSNTFIAACTQGLLLFTSSSITTIGNPGGTIYCVAEHPDGHLLTGTRDGLFRRDITSSQFVNVLPTSTISAWVYCMYVAKNGYIYAGTSGRGVYYSTDTGLTWQPFMNGMGEYEEVNDLKTNPAGYLFANGASYNRVYETIYPVEPPQTAKLFSPTDDTTGLMSDIKLDWDTALTTALYTLQVSTDSLFSNIIINDSTLVLSEYNLQSSQLQSNSEYFWRVLGKNFAGKGDWSQVRRFTTGILVGVEEELYEETMDQKVSISVYPNPSKNRLNLSINSKSGGNTSVKLFNTLGEVVYKSGDIPLENGRTDYSINHDLPTGIYILTAVINSSSGEQSIISQKVSVVR
jgi:hypothetical protein